MADATTYEVLECGKGSIIALIGLVDKDNDRSPVSAVNWRVKVALSTYTSPCVIRIYSKKIANGTIEVVMPAAPSGQTYSLVSKSIGNPLRFGLVDAGLVSITSTGVSFIEVKSADKLQATIEGIPSDVDLVVDATSPSRMNVKQLRSNILALNFNVTLPSYLKNVTVIATGKKSASSVSLPSASTIEYRNGCVTTIPPRGNITYSLPFLARVKSSLVSSEAIARSCLLYTNSTAKLSIIGSTTTQVNVTIGPNVSPVLSVTAGVASLLDTTVWRTVAVRDKFLTFDQRYNMTLSVTEVLVAPSMLTNRTSIDVVCKGGSSPPAWKFGLRPDYSFIKWSSLTCNGIISVPILKYSLNGLGVSSFVTYPLSQGTVNLRAKLGVASTNTILTVNDGDLSLDGTGTLTVQDLALNSKDGTGVLSLTNNGGRSTFTKVKNVYQATNVNTVSSSYLQKALGRLNITSIFKSGKMAIDLDNGHWNATSALNFTAGLSSGTGNINVTGYSEGTPISGFVDSKALRVDLKQITFVHVLQKGNFLRNSVRGTSTPAEATVFLGERRMTLNDVKEFFANLTGQNGTLVVDSKSTRTPAFVDFRDSTIRLMETDTLSSFMRRTQRPLGSLNLTSVTTDSSANFTFASGRVSIAAFKSLFANYSASSRAVLDAVASNSKAIFSIEEDTINFDKVSQLLLNLTSATLGKLKLSSTNIEPSSYAINTRLASFDIMSVRALNASLTSETENYVLVTQNGFAGGSPVKIALSRRDISLPSYQKLDFALINKVLRCTVNLTATSGEAVFRANTSSCTFTSTNATNFTLTKVDPTTKLNVTAFKASIASLASLNADGDFHMDSILSFNAVVKKADDLLNLTTSGTIDSFDYLSNVRKKSQGFIVQQAGLFTLDFVKTTLRGIIRSQSIPSRDSRRKGDFFVQESKAQLSGAANYTLEAIFWDFGRMDAVGKGWDMDYDVNLGPTSARYSGRGSLDLGVALISGLSEDSIPEASILDSDGSTMRRRATPPRPPTTFVDRNVTLHDTGMSITESDKGDFVITTGNATSLASISLVVYDGENIITVDSTELFPVIELKPEVGATSVTSTIPTPLQVLDQPIFDPDERTLGLTDSKKKKDDDDETDEDGVDTDVCLQPNFICSDPSWLELATFDATCLSEYHREIECGSNTTGIQLRFNGKVQCIVPSSSVGWTVTTRVQDVDDIQSSWVRYLMIAVFTWHLLVLVFSWSFFSSVLVEGWVAIGLTAMLAKQPTLPDSNVISLSIVKEAHYLFDSWFYKDICSGVNEYPTWGIIFLSFLTVIVLALYHRTDPNTRTAKVSPSGYTLCTFDVAILLRGGTDVTKRLATSLGLFWLAPTVVSHLMVDTEASVFITTVAIASVCVLLLAFSIDTFLIPGWIHREPPGKLAFAVWPKKPLGLVVMFFLLSLLVLPPSLVHFRVFDTSGWYVAVVLLNIFFVFFSLAKEFVLVKQDSRDMKWLIFLFVASLFSIGFGIAFVFFLRGRFTSGKIATILWIFWAIVSPLCFQVREVARFYFTKQVVDPLTEQELGEIETNGYKAV